MQYITWACFRNVVLIETVPTIAQIYVSTKYKKHNILSSVFGQFYSSKSGLILYSCVNALFKLPYGRRSLPDLNLDGPTLSPKTIENLADLNRRSKTLRPWNPKMFSFWYIHFFTILHTPSLNSIVHTKTCKIEKTYLHSTGCILVLHLLCSISILIEIHVSKQYNS